MSLKDTLNLPDPDFSIPMKADLSKREPEMQAKWQEMGIYQVIQDSRKDAPAYTLHDGPPYTNSAIHVGTALNKILKDFVVKSQTMMGKRAPYVPGFDNHGLPIEMAVAAKLEKEGIKNPDIVTLRKRCREHAQHFIEVQTEQFQRLGVFGMWDRPYTSMDYPYEAEIIRVFKRLIEGGYIYRGLRPVLWSPTSQTALADTEIVYQDHTSRSIYVKFPLLEDKNNLFTGLENLSCVIWTTTPWTIPANLAVAFHPHLTYIVVKTNNEHLIVEEHLLDATMEKAGIESYQKVKEFRGSEIEFSKFKHPVYNRESLAVLAEYVTTEDGTGIVHTAPGHGREDFITGQKYNLPVLCPVNEKGVLTEEAGEFAGIFYKKCDQAVVERLQELGALLYTEDFNHQYPHAERDGQPVIFRATEQWFIGIDQPFHLDSSQTLRQKMLTEIEDVKWYPDGSISRIKAMVENRPDWCISRQRPWGVGIPIFYGKESGEPVLDPVAIESVANHIQTHGSDAWYTATPAELLPNGYKHPQTGETEFTKEVDVFDVWFDSGSTHLAVLEGNVEPRWKEDLPCDLFLEGSDQHRGWFNVSLILGVACRGHAPYKEVLTHGFVVDGEGRKMSKRLGNVIDPVQASDQYGAEILRYWAASVNYEHDCPCSDQLLKVAGDHYRSVRNTLRYLLSNLADYDPQAPHELSPLDQWVMQATDKLSERVVASYHRYEFNQALKAVHDFCIEDLSRFYLDATKDSMYCDGATWPSRRGAQHASHYVLNRLTRLIAPILVHTAEEVYARIPAITHLPTIHAEIFLAPDHEFNQDLHQKVDTLLKIREKTFAEAEQWRKENGIKNPQDIETTLHLTQEQIDHLSLFQDLPNIFKMAEVTLLPGDQAPQFKKSDYALCDRSRVRRPDVQPATFEGEPVNLSARDKRALGI